MANLSLGTLNKFYTRMRVTDIPALNITPAELGSEEMLKMDTEGNATDTVPVGYGVVQSPNLYVMATISIPVLKTGSIAQAWYDQVGKNSLIGNVILRDDVGREVTVTNCSIIKYPSFTTNGKTGAYEYQVKGAIAVNKDLTSI